MDFQDILNCLENPEKRNEYIARLKAFGESSQPVLDLKNSMEGVKMNKPPKHIFETTMLQHTFKYCYPLECFLQFRLVCKSWRYAVEKIKFDDFQLANIAEYANHPAFVSKFLPMFKKIDIALFQPVFESEQVRKRLLSNIVNLNQIRMFADFPEEKKFVESFIKQFYQNSNKTLKKIVHVGKFLPDLDFPKVTDIVLDLSPSLNKTFIPTLLIILKNMEKIQVIIVETSGGNNNENVYDFIGQNYPKHCISSISDAVDTMLDYFPLKVCAPTHLSDIDEKAYTFEIEYLCAYIPDLTDPTDGDWERYEEILNQCTKLKKIAFVNFDEIDINFEAKNIPNIWKNMLGYLKKREIDIIPKSEINNDNLFNKIAKEVGVKWRLDFYGS